jgi:hydroxymethylglutaryl-CoA lyase
MIRIVEVGPRDGLQNEPKTIPTDVKVAYIDALSESGVDEIEASAFVSPKWVPQLADASDVFARIQRKPGVVYSALVPNEQGLERAHAARVDKIAVFTAASETFNKTNINCTIDESLKRFEPVVKKTKLPVRGYVSTAFWCPYEGKIDPKKVVEVIRKLIDLGCGDISIGDTIGKAVPDEVNALIDLLPKGNYAMHFHDTYHHAVENMLASWKRGIATFDSSAGGIGGCPYAPGASGNIATETVIEKLKAAGAPVRAEGQKILEAKRIISQALGK